MEVAWGETIVEFISKTQFQPSWMHIRPYLHIIAIIGVFFKSFYPEIG
jgi:hypothetical protein